MILRFESERLKEPSWKKNEVLAGLYDYWLANSTPYGAPLSESLFLSDLVSEMPHMMLAYACRGAFRVEFAGQNVRSLLGEDPIGWTTGGRAKAALPRAVADCVAQAGRLGAPRSAVDAGMIVLSLPFASDVGSIDLVMSGLCPAAGQPAEVVALRR